MTSIPPEVAIDVLTQLDVELGVISPDIRAVVALRADPSGAIALTDVVLRSNQVLEAPPDSGGLVVVTAEEVADGEEVIGLTQLVCILRDGTEIGLYRTDDNEPPRIWRTDDDRAGDADQLRPRDTASNAARRALGAPSLIEPVDIRDVAARAWLLRIATAAIQRFDTPDGPADVVPADLDGMEAGPPFAIEGRTARDPLPSWDELHAAAIAGKLELAGNLTVDADHARWLDRDGFAQIMDSSLPLTDELLNSLRITGEDELLAWAVEQLSAHDWFRQQALG